MRKCLIYLEFPEKYISQLKKIANHYEFISCTDKSELMKHLSDMEILIIFVAKFEAELLGLAPNLKWIQAITAGVDNLPLKEIKDRRIILTNTRGIHKIQMAEFTIAAMINFARNFHRMHRNQIKGVWDRSMSQAEIYGKVVGIIGLGSIGEEIARKASFFGMRVLGVRKNPQPMKYVDQVYGIEEMDAVFQESDYIINLLPLTAGTQKIIDKHYFSAMKKTACFINIGRGPTVNQADLVDALKSNQIGGLVADVYEEEPLPEDSPLWKLENVILAPHIAGVSPNYIKRAMDVIRHNLKVYVSQSGEMMNVIDCNSGY
ncbi:MAG: D-2-hydroxyacid dehydrogenase [Desulfobacterales bacterium]|jgi:phosphoglycerate dehydrogenase-like enzyme|nr:D-2-hydroxyacid dehydrogenase [Desulfobacterales bacterium]